MRKIKAIFAYKACCNALYYSAYKTLGQIKHYA